MVRQVVLSTTQREFSNPIVGERTIKAIAVDAARDMVYWTDGPTKTVKRGRLPHNRIDTYTIPQDLQIPGLQQPLGITYDWYSE